MDRPLQRGDISTMFRFVSRVLVFHFFLSFVSAASGILISSKVSAKGNYLYFIQANMEIYAVVLKKVSRGTRTGTKNQNAIQEFCKLGEDFHKKIKVT